MWDYGAVKAWNSLPLVDIASTLALAGSNPVSGNNFGCAASRALELVACVRL